MRNCCIYYSVEQKRKGKCEMSKDFLDCKTVKECVEWYLAESEGKERDVEFDLGFITSLFDNHYWELVDEAEELKLEAERKSRIAECLKDSEVLEDIVEWA